MGLSRRFPSNAVRDLLSSAVSVERAVALDAQPERLQNPMHQRDRE